MCIAVLDKYVLARQRLSSSVLSSELATDCAHAHTECLQYERSDKSYSVANTGYAQSQCDTQCN